MFVIFSAFKKVFSFIKYYSFTVKVVCFALAALISIGITAASTGMTLGLRVDYAGKPIATVRDVSVFDQAKTIVISEIQGLHDEKMISQPKFHLTLTVAARFDSPAKLANILIQNTAEIAEASALVVNGQIVVYTQWDKLENYLESARTRYDLPEAQNTSVFVDTVEVASGYYVLSEVAGQKEVQSVVDALEVKTISVQTTDYEIPFEKKTENTSSQLIGYSKITIPGKNGLGRKTETIEKRNGLEVARTLVSDEQIADPVTQVTTVGTAKSTVSAQQHVKAQRAGFILPLDAGCFTVSAYYGDGRNHKGIDLAAGAGTPIYAVADGTVVSSGYNGNYGYSVVVDHGNGVQTRYAHASALNVAAGAAVRQGDVVAFVGRTGQATGNHLHFEVIINGTRVNPAPYLSLD